MSFSVNVSKMDQLMDLIGELVISESVVLQSSDLKVPGLNLDNFNKAADPHLPRLGSGGQCDSALLRLAAVHTLLIGLNAVIHCISHQVHISVEDNGKGLDREKILAKARKQGMLDESKPDSAYTP